jgi:hypothetical protein
MNGVCAYHLQPVRQLGLPIRKLEEGPGRERECYHEQEQRGEEADVCADGAD